MVRYSAFQDGGLPAAASSAQPAIRPNFFLETIREGTWEYDGKIVFRLVHATRRPLRCERALPSIFAGFL